MIAMMKEENIFDKKATDRWIDQNDKIIIYNKGDVVFAFNFHPTRSFERYFIPVEKAGTYDVILSTDDSEYGGFGRTDSEYRYKSLSEREKGKGFYCYLPSRCAVVFKRTPRK